MTYTPKEWETGDIIGATDLNNIEEGIANAGGFFIVGYSDDDGTTLDKTWEEIRDAMLSGKVPAVVEIDDNGDAETTLSFREFLTGTGIIEQTEGSSTVSIYTVLIYNDESGHYECLTPDGYPIFTED